MFAPLKLENDKAFRLIRNFFKEISCFLKNLIPLAILIGFVQLTIFSLSLKVNTSFFAANSIILSIVLGAKISIFISLYYIIFLNQLLFADLLPQKMLAAFQSSEVKERLSIILFYMLSGITLPALFIIYTIIFYVPNWNRPEIILTLSLIVLLFTLILYVMFELPKHNVENNKKVWGKFLVYNLLLLLNYFFASSFSNDILKLNSYYSFLAFTLIFVYFQCGLVSIYTHAAIQKDSIRLLKLLSGLFLIFTYLVIFIAGKKMIIYSVLNCVDVDWENPKQYSITNNQAEMIDHSLWKKINGKNLTIPLCVIFDDGATIHTISLDGTALELTKNESKPDYTAKKHNNDNNCIKLIETLMNKKRKIDPG